VCPDPICIYSGFRIVTTSIPATRSLAASSGWRAASGSRDVSRYPRRSYHSRIRLRWGCIGWDSSTSSCIAPRPARAASSSASRTRASPNPRPCTEGSTPSTPNQPVRPSSARARTEPTTSLARSATAVSRRDIDVRTSSMSVRSILVAKSPTSACAYARFTTSTTAGASAKSSATSGSSHRTATTPRSYRSILARERGGVRGLGGLSASVFVRDSSSIMPWRAHSHSSRKIRRSAISCPSGLSWSCRMTSARTSLGEVRTRRRSRRAAGPSVSASRAASSQNTGARAYQRPGPQGGFVWRWEELVGHGAVTRASSSAARCISRADRGTRRRRLRTGSQGRSRTLRTGSRPSRRGSRSRRCCARHTGQPRAG
jgi:hypothetical protein